MDRHVFCSDFDVNFVELMIPIIVGVSSCDMLGFVNNS